MAALFGILGSAIGAGGVGVGIAAVNGAFGNFSLQDNADQLSPEEKAQVSSLSPNDRDARASLPYDKELQNKILSWIKLPTPLAMEVAQTRKLSMVLLEVRRI